MTKRINVVRQEDIKYLTAANLIEKINELSEKYQISKDKITVEYDAYEEYGSSTADVYLCFSSPETDEEMEDRVRKEKLWAKQAQDRERQQYELLKKKFESN